MKTATILLILFAGLGVSAQSRLFRWDDELCRFEGTYDAKKFNVTQLRNTLKLIEHGEDFTLTTNSTVWKISEIGNLNVAGYDAEYDKKSAALKALDIVKVPYWENLRQKKIHELEQVHNLNRATMRAYQDRKALLEYKDAPACTAKFANPLIAGGDDLLKAWQAVNDESRKNNGDPGRLNRIFDEQRNSADKMQFALIEVMTFGWSNCAHALIEYVAYDGSPEKEFKKLFKKTRTIRCDEP